MEKKKPKLKYIIFSLVPLIALMIILELFLRIVYFQRNNKETFAITALYEKIKNRNKTIELPSRHIRLKELQPLLDIKLKPQPAYLRNSENLVDKEYSFRTDPDGFLLPENKFDQADLSIVFLGGSTTECSFVTEDLRFPYLVGKSLNKETKRKINVFNSGVSGNHTYHTIDLLLNKIIPLQPEYVVLMESINDWTTLLFEGTYWNRNPTRSLIIDPNSKVLVSDDEWALIRGKKLKLDLDHILDEFRKAQLTFIAICKANGIEPILMTQANRYLEKPDEKILKNAEQSLQSFGLNYQDAKSIHTAMNEVTRMNAASQNLTLIDLDKGIPKSGELMYDIVHFNDKGSILAADIISKQILTIIK
jgi:lysophospholipase L1-like esterase